MTSKWEVVRLGDVADFQNGYPFKPNDLGSVGKPVIRIKQLMNQNIEPDRSQLDVPSRFLIGSGDIIFSWSGRIEAVLWDRGEALLNQHLYHVSRKSELFSDAFLLLSLQFIIPDLHLHGSTMKHVTKKELVATGITCPPLAEQRRIVDLIGAMDDAIEAAECRWADETKLLLEFIVSCQQSKGTVPLGVLADLQVGFAFKSETFSDSGVKLLRGDNIGHGRLRWDDAKMIAGHHVQKKMLGYDLHANDLIVALDRPVISSGTKTALVVEQDLPAFLVQRVCRLRFVDENVARGMLAVFQSNAFQRYVLGSQTGSHVPHINKKIVEDYPIAKVLLEESNLNLIGSLLDATERAETHVDRLRNLRSELLTSLLSGAHEIPESYDEVMNAI